MPTNLRSFTDAAAQAVAQTIATVRRDAAREKELRDAEYRARLAELDTRILAVLDLERRVAERLASLKDGDPGKSVSVEDVTPLLVAEIDRRFGELPKPKDGKDVDEAFVAELVTVRVREAIAALPVTRDGKDADPAVIAELVSRAVTALPPPAPGAPGKPGKDTDPELMASLVEKSVRAAVAALPAPEKGDPGPMGALPMVRAWEDRVYYQSNVVTHAGSLYQASRDTAKEPPHADWVCLAAVGRNGADGRSFTIRRTFQDGENYDKLDVVSLNGASFAAKRDKPGMCPGDGWQLIAKQGGPGKPGEPGRPGKVERGPKVEALSISDEGMLTLRHEDGSTVSCDLYPVLAKIS